jgi:predicted AlkP superfamily phosphohydrolase/phosphomutase
MICVIGFDGLNWKSIEYFRGHLPNLEQVVRNWEIGYLEIDSIPHSAPSWTTIWTGRHWEEHGILEFVHLGEQGQRLDWITEQDFKFPFIWEVLERAGLDARAFSIFCKLPPLTFRAETPYELIWDEEITPDLMQRNLDSVFDNFVGHLDSDFLALTVITLDKSHHIGTKFCDHPLDSSLYAYKMVDEFLGEVLDYSNINFVLVSDHGIPGNAWKHPNGFLIPAHEPTGIFATNIGGVSIPKKSTEIFKWLLNLYDIDLAKVDVTPQRDNACGLLTSEESEKLLNHLRELGYVE